MGFESWSKDQLREISSKGGHAVVAKGTGHRWTREQARAAGIKGAAVARAKKIQQVVEETAP